MAVATTAALQFEADELTKFESPEAMETESYASVVERLGDLRASNEDIKYAYLMRRTMDPNTVEFIADADSLASPEEVDEDGDGVLQDYEIPPALGDPYDVTEYPVLRDEAFYHPAVDRELQPDQWGLLMAAYSPIKNDNGDTVAIIGLDVIVDDFLERTRATLLPFLLFIVFLITLLTLVSLILVRVNEGRVEAMRELDRQKDELLSIVSHQLATPVTSIKWSLEMMRDGDIGEFTPQQIEQIGTLQRTTANLTDLVSMILDVSRLQLGRMQVSRAPLNVEQFFSDIIDEMQPKVKEKGVHFNVKRPKEPLPQAMLDARLCRMTLENLLSNAIKYTPKDGDVNFTIEYDEKKKILTYVIQDTGVGIPKKDQDKLFTKLFRASNVRNKIDGNGFGLFVAKGALEAQGGTLDFESEEDHGTMFKATLPITFAEEKKA